MARQVHGIGPDPHAASGLRVAAAYARGVRVLPELLGTQFLPRGVVRELARRRFARIVAHAKAHSPFYRAHFARIDPSRAAPADVPLLDKASLRDRGPELICEGVDRRRLLERSSSGSSGVPTRIAFDPLRELPRRVQELRLLTAHGMRPSDRQLVFDHPGHQTDKQFTLQKVGLWRRMPYPWQLPIEEGVRFIEGERPEILHGVLSSLRLLAIAVGDRALSYAPRLLVSKGELLDPATRGLCERVLRAKLVDYYATEEAGILAWQAPDADGYWIDEDLVLLETIDPDTGRPTARGEPGEIVVTNLYMRSMPIIRYRTGDLGVIEDEPRGASRGLPLLRELRGRKTDCVLTPEGEVHHPFALLGVMEESEELAGFRIRQEAIDRLVVALAVRQGTSADRRRALEDRIRAAMRARLGASMQVAIEELGDARPGVGEKFPLVQGLPSATLRELMGKHARL